MTTGNPLSAPRRDPTARDAIRRADRHTPCRKAGRDGPPESAIATAFLDALTRPMTLGVPAALIVNAFKEATSFQRA